ncbi:MULTISPECIES: hypothetical protein [Rhizobium]|uniref:hypothetical protein n=1 Tax=Rhizobium TaxID=379 RepID=UPI0010316A5E|nr:MULTISPECIES: hypothetical protein [Rhizobium]MBA1343965.1 hypothetical protein [Rhizobium sp. WYCCWR 11146]TBF89110.1 hypothetical protein ELG82_36810 [Rhizobium leguminosarum]
MGTILKFPTPDDETRASAVDVAALLCELERPVTPVEDQLAAMITGLSEIECGSLIEKHSDLLFQAMPGYADADLSNGGERPFWAEQYNAAYEEIMQAQALIRSARSRLSFTLWHAFPKQKAVNPDWMDAYVGAAHKAIDFQTFDNRDGSSVISVSSNGTCRHIEYSDADMALVALILRSHDFKRHRSDGENGPQWFIRGPITDDIKFSIGAELEKFDFLAVAWEDVTR